LLVGGFFLLTCLERKLSWGLALGSVFLVVAPVALNPFYAPNVLDVGRFVLTAPVLHHIYPWAYARAGQAILWYGDLSVSRVPANKLGIVAGLGLVTTISGLAGLVTWSFRSWLLWRKDPRTDTRTCCTVSLALVGLAFLPVLVFVKDQEHSYQLFKLLTSISPILALGVVAAGCLVSRGISWAVPARSTWTRLLIGVVWIPILTTVGGAGLGTLYLQRKSVDLTIRETAMTRYSMQAVALHPSMHELTGALARVKGCALLYRAQTTMPYIQNDWIAYLGRHCRVWLANPNLHGLAIGADRRYAATADLTQLPPDFLLFLRRLNASLRHSVDLNQLPPDFLVLSPCPSVFLRPPDNLPASAVCWQCPSFKLWRPGMAQWVTVVHVDTPYGVETDGKAAGMWMGGGATVVELYTTEAGNGRLKIDLQPGPGMDPAEPMWILVSDGSGVEQSLECRAGPGVLTFPLVKGMNAVRLMPLAAPGRHGPNDDNRQLVFRLQIQGVEMAPRQ
jgi:hypothetical protein